MKRRNEGWLRHGVFSTGQTEAVIARQLALHQNDTEATSALSSRSTVSLRPRLQSKLI